MSLILCSGFLPRNVYVYMLCYVPVPTGTDSIVGVRWASGLSMSGVQELYNFGRVSDDLIPPT